MSGWRMRWGTGGTAPGERNVRHSPLQAGPCDGPYLEQQVGPEQWEEDDGGTAKEDQLEHADDEPGQQQTSGERREDTVILEF